MLSVFNNRKPFYNKSLMDYCRKSTEESIKKFVEREKEKNKVKENIDFNITNLQVLPNNNNNNNNNNAIGVFFIILSTSSFIYYFLKTRK
jgi:hypothetical protein